MTLLSRWWTELPRSAGSPDNVSVFGEQAGARAAVFDAITEMTKDHFISAELLESLEFPLAAAMVRARVPKGKQIRSGDFGEVLCTEYVNHYTEYHVPLKRLRHKDTAEMSMRGEDLIAIREKNGRAQILKGESKSRATLREDVVGTACTALCRGDSRPSEDTLTFIYMRLCEQGLDEEAELVKRCMSETITHGDVEHLIFTFSGNDPVPALSPYAKGPVARRLTGFVAPDHQHLIQSVFEAIHANA